MKNERLLTLVKDVSPKYLVALYLVLVLAVGLVVSSLLLYPQEQRLEAMKRKLQQENQKVAVVENFVLTHPNMEQYLSELQQAMNRAEAALPGNIEISAFLSQLEKDARAAGVKLMNVKPAVVAERQGYRELPVELGVEGGYFATMSFLKKLEDGSRFSAPTAFMIQQKKDLLSAKLNLQIFSYGNSPKPPVGAAAQKPPAGGAPAAR